MAPISRFRAGAAAGLMPPLPTADRGYLKLFLEHVTQAEEGCDFDFLRAAKITQRVPRK